MLGDVEINASSVGKLVVLVLSVALHEAAHAFVADRLGDPTARRLGRVTLNPLRHLDPILSVLLPAVLVFTHAPFLFGAGKPVPVVRQQLRRPARDFALVAFAGPASNLFLAVVFSVLVVVLSRAEVVEPTSVARVLLNYGVMINLVLAVFNLIPVPPLDGSRLVAFFLPDRVREAFYGLDRFAVLFIVALLVTGAFQRIMTVTYLPLFNTWYDTLVRLAAV